MLQWHFRGATSPLRPSCSFESSCRSVVCITCSGSSDRRGRSWVARSSIHARHSIWSCSDRRSSLRHFRALFAPLPGRHIPPLHAARARCSHLLRSKVECPRTRFASDPVLLWTWVCRTSTSSSVSAPLHCLRRAVWMQGIPSRTAQADVRDLLCTRAVEVRSTLGGSPGFERLGTPFGRADRPGWFPFRTGRSLDEGGRTGLCGCSPQPRTRSNTTVTTLVGSLPGRPLDGWGSSRFVEEGRAGNIRVKPDARLDFLRHPGAQPEDR